MGRRETSEYGKRMILTRELERVLEAMYKLAGGTTAVQVDIGSIHSAFFAMDVSDLVRHLRVLFDCGFIKNAVPSQEKLGNYYYLTLEGVLYYHRISDQKS